MATESFEAVKKAVSDFITHEILLLDEPLGDDEDLFDAGFDSLSITRLLVFVEKHYGVLIPDHEVDIDEVSTLQTMSAFIHSSIEAHKAGK